VASVEDQLEDSREGRCNALIKRSMLLSMGVGLIPVPFIDVIAVTVVQLNMLERLAAEYDLGFEQLRVKPMVLALSANLAADVFTRVFLRRVGAGIPGFGPLLGLLSVSIIDGATTYALGQVFRLHFASGGTFLTFDPKQVRDYFAEQYRAGKMVARGAPA